MQRPRAQSTRPVLPHRQPRPARACLPIALAIAALQLTIQAPAEPACPAATGFFDAIQALDAEAVATTLAGSPGCARATTADDPQRPALHAALLANGADDADRPPVVGLLLDGGAPVDARDGRGDTPLLIAARWPTPGRIAAAMLLLRHGADPALADIDGLAPLHHAVRNPAGTVLARRLLALDGDAGVRSADARTPLMLAAAAGNEAAVSLLLGLRASVHDRDRAGHTALHHAAMAGHGRVIDRLLAVGADINARSHAGQSAAMLATLHRQRGIVQQLAARGADMQGVRAP